MSTYDTIVIMWSVWNSRILDTIHFKHTSTIFLKCDISWTADDNLIYLIPDSMSYLCYLCLFGNSGIQHIFCGVFPCFLRLVYPMLSIFLDCPFLIAPSVFSNVYFMENCIFWFLVLFPFRLNYCYNECKLTLVKNAWNLYLGYNIACR